MSNIKEDVAACEAKLGREPVLSAKDKKNVTLSESVTERLKTGLVDGDRLDNYDNYWINKLACIDESHSVRNNLDIDEAENTLRSLTKYAQSGRENNISVSNLHMDRNNVQNCLEASRGETLTCSDNVEQFIQEVDRSMYEAVRKDLEDPAMLEKKMTYAEKFRRDSKL